MFQGITNMPPIQIVGKGTTFFKMSEKLFEAVSKEAFSTRIILIYVDLLTSINIR
jgi:hypothetical protein